MSLFLTEHFPILAGTQVFVRGIYFVTRLKKSANYRVIERRETQHLKNISSHRIIEFKDKERMPYRLRRIRCKDPKTDKYIILLTNQLEWSAKTSASIYKDRWQIDLFFKTLKQQLKIKSFVCTSKNALLSQLWIALITYLLLCYLKFKSKFSWSLYTFYVQFFRPTFFQEDITTAITT